MAAARIVPKLNGIGDKPPQKFLCNILSKTASPVHEALIVPRRLALVEGRAQAPSAAGPGRHFKDGSVKDLFKADSLSRVFARQVPELGAGAGPSSVPDLTVFTSHEPKENQL